MTRYARILEILTNELSPSEITLTDDSSKHAGHAGAAPGGQTHYTLLVISDKFKGLSKVARHQLVYRCLADEFKTGLHALSIDAREPD